MSSGAAVFVLGPAGSGKVKPKKGGRHFILFYVMLFYFILFYVSQLFVNIYWNIARVSVEVPI